MTENDDKKRSHTNDDNGSSLKTVGSDPSKRRTGGLYSKINMSVTSANIMVDVLTLILVAATILIVNHNGFTIKFETNGGSQIESVRALHSQLIVLKEAPVKEGYVFTGWFTEAECVNKWDLNKDTVSGSMTLYAGWAKKE